MANLHPWPRTVNTIDFIQHINVAPSVIWPYLVEQEKLGTWLDVSKATVPREIGAPFFMGWEVIGFEGGPMDYGYRGTVERYEEEKLLALNWILPKSGDTTYLSIQLQQSFATFGEDAQEESDLWLIHSGFSESGLGLHEFDGHHRHWRQSLGRLAAQLEDRPPRPKPYTLAGLKLVGGAPNIGILIDDVANDSPGSRAGIRAGDIVRSINGRPMPSLDDFHDWIDETVPGDVGVFDLGDRTTELTVAASDEVRENVYFKQDGKWVRI